MAENVVKDVGFLQIVELLRRADEIARRKAAMGEMVEKDIVGNQPRHRDHPPPGRVNQSRDEVAIAGDARLFESQHVASAQARPRRSEQRRVGHDGVSTGRLRWPLYHEETTVSKKIK